MDQILIHIMQVVLLAAINFIWGFRVGLGDSKPTSEQAKKKKRADILQWVALIGITIGLVVRQMS